MARRAKNRSTKAKPFAIYASDAGSCRVAEWVSLDEGLDRERRGTVDRKYDTYTGELIGFTLRVRVEDDSSLASRSTPAAIGAPSRKRPTDPHRVSEMEVFAFAGTSFLDANSHTARLSEVDRLAREKSGREAEDNIERTVAKVVVWRAVGHKRRDIVRVWPKGGAA